MYISTSARTGKEGRQRYFSDSKDQLSSMTQRSKDVNDYIDHNGNDIWYALQNAVKIGHHKMAKRIVKTEQFKACYDLSKIEFDSFNLFKNLFEEGNEKQIKLILETCQAIGVLKRQLCINDKAVLRWALACDSDNILTLILDFYKQANLLSEALDYAVSNNKANLVKIILNDYKSSRLLDSILCHEISSMLMTAAKSYQDEMVGLILSKYLNVKIASMALNMVLDNCDEWSVIFLLEQYKIAGMALDDESEFMKPKLIVYGIINNLFKAKSIKKLRVELYRLYHYLSARPYKLHYFGGDFIRFQGKNKKVPRNIKLVLFEYDECIEDVHTLEQGERLRDCMLEYCIEAAVNPPSYLCGIFHPRDAEMQSLYNWISDAVSINSNGAIFEATN